MDMHAYQDAAMEQMVNALKAAIEHESYLQQQVATAYGNILREQGVLVDLQRELSTTQGRSRELLVSLQHLTRGRCCQGCADASSPDKVAEGVPPPF